MLARRSRSVARTLADVLSELWDGAAARASLYRLWTIVPAPGGAPERTAPGPAVPASRDE
jgi:hypothetical protein